MFTRERAFLVRSLRVPRDGGEVYRRHVHVALIELKVRGMGNAVTLAGIRQPREVEREVIDLPQDPERSETFAFQRTIG